MQKFPQVGLRAVFEISGFNRAWNQYQRVARDIDRITQKTANRVNRATQGMARSFTDFARRSSIVQEAFDNLRPSAAIAEFQRLNQAFLDLGDKAQVNVELFDHLANAGIGFSEAMQVAGGQIQFNLPAFDSLIQKGVDADAAFQRAAGGASKAGQSINLLGRSFTVTALATAAAIKVFRLGVRVIRESVEAYDELAEATRRLHHQTGLLTREASSWINIAQEAGISTGASERAMAMFLSRVADTRREMSSSGRSTSDFARAMDTLGVSILDNEGNLKTTDQLLNDVNQAFQRLGPGIVSSQLATDIFGRTGRQLLPILTDQEQSLSDLADQVERYGANLGAIDRAQFEELRNSQARLRESTVGLANEISRGWTETRTNVNNALAEIVNAFRKVDAFVRATGLLDFSNIFGSATASALRAQEQQATTFRERYEFFLRGETEMARHGSERNCRRPWTHLRRS
jgi:hypothetical protein